MHFENVRLAGLLKIIAGSALFALGFWVILNYGDELGGTYKGPVWPAIAAGAPGAIALVGIIELVSGVRFTTIARSWDSMPEWKRWTLGGLIVLLAIAAVCGIFLALAFSGVI